MIALATQITRPVRCGALWVLMTAAAMHASPMPARASPTGADGARAPRVVVLYSDDRLLRANVVFDADLRQALSENVGAAIECYSEFLDEVRFPARHQERTLDLLRAKYGERPPDVIVAFAPASLDFCLRFRPVLFPHTPIVFTAIDIDTFLGTEETSQVTGVRSRFDGAATLRLALQLHPETQRVFVVADSSALSSAHAPLGWSDFREADFGIPFEHLTGLPTHELLERLGRLPDHSVVIYTSMFGGSTSNTVPAHLQAEQISRASTAPIYAALDAFIGHGVVGAVTTPTETMARRTAEMVEQVLARESDQDVPQVQTLAAIPMFDWRQLRRWNVSEKQLPPGSIVLFAPPSLWQQHARWVAVATAVFLVQSGLILALVLQSVRRRRAEREAQSRRQELAHTTRVATMGELTASLAHEINQPLAAILSNAQAARRLLAAGANDTEIGEILDDIAADDQRAGEVIRRMRTLLRKGGSELSTIDIHELVSEVAKLVHGELILQNVSLALDLPSAALSVRGDRIQLQQVLLNLVMNALDAMKDAPSGEHKLRIRVQAVDPWIRISVIDSGAGIPEASLAHIFDRFVTTKPHGMGLGLAICSSIIEAHGGRVGGRNNAERGATFWFEIPALAEVET